MTSSRELILAAREASSGLGERGEGLLALRFFDFLAGGQSAIVEFERTLDPEWVREFAVFVTGRGRFETVSRPVRFSTGSEFRWGFGGFLSSLLSSLLGVGDLFFTLDPGGEDPGRPSVEDRRALEEGLW